MSSATSTIHPGLELGEVQLKVSNLERSLAFYQHVVGLRILKREGNRAHLTADGHKVLVVLEEVPNASITQPRTASGLYHFAILVPTRQALGVVLRRLIDLGIHIGQADHLVSEALYISDPDYNGIEIYRDRPREDWPRDKDGQIRMATDPIDWEGLLQEAAGSSSETAALPPDTKIGHMHFHVSDIAESGRFYCDVLGFELIGNYMRQMGALFVSAGGYHHHIGLNVWAGAGTPMPPANGTGIGYYTIVMPDEAELKKLLDRIGRAGIAVREHDQAWFVTDPTGIEIKLIASQK
ncbi:Catechol-2,3-dioxygenase [Paenibacillus sp. CECT 9249]|uniref:VOC family protein n=1 Tax=Paenibacillus sp. CECT 9249 TaxID=2845385 RepID=UPI001E299557|nr:VOC family protein [Paenibacillus sp. CECT 9249]CAH0119999.1 Catechol-2,3-dioxygenase [Paenibacillus sp. CECT 9249]